MYEEILNLAAQKSVIRITRRNSSTVVRHDYEVSNPKGNRVRRDCVACGFDMIGQQVRLVKQESSRTRLKNLHFSSINSTYGAGSTPSNKQDAKIQHGRSMLPMIQSEGDRRRPECRGRICLISTRYANCNLQARSRRQPSLQYVMSARRLTRRRRQRQLLLIIHQIL
jgi:hypothetical protein